MSINKQALELFEQNEYNEAFELMKLAVKKNRDVQSLNNLAWMYLREEEDTITAKELLEEVVILQPNSPFPYTMLGEIELKEEHFNKAKDYLTTVISLGFSEEAIHNLGIVHFKLDEYKEAAQEFNKVAGDSDYTRLHEVVAWLYAGEGQKAKQLLNSWNEQADAYTGATEIADVYIEMNCFKEAREQFEKEWHCGIITPYIISRFAYTLMQLGDTESCKKMIQQALSEKTLEITEEQLEECDEHWTELDKAERMTELIQEKNELESLFKQLQKGYVPPFEYDLYPMGGCQLFGCKQHGHDEYRD